MRNNKMEVPPAAASEIIYAAMIVIVYLKITMKYYRLQHI